ncbi:heat-inducible transcription repressor HrcA [Staphylococcus condimenti]|uniref:Heat-inducible transcription repressor HrcA n=3 Tax=Staphylococcus condimenti TaxID=70255 RepID=A0AB37H1X3_9STAP|nr:MULTISPECIES: heat-inducible transcriptional repressor HrcA [Staphylococcus]AMY04654.1 HrcA family transcriptional regulator [Staphylococcus condimenti]APR60893.1 heat-inducible transcription repressor HrcA [Staphylococcus condimenti]MDK8644656.1 heat-inducible transcriptional repressor HrcA [Staphylococcus condimenti]OFO99036.1 HrcA family transcriptional regulator [Staphylococcus sp. HMSC065E08]PNZ60828.1 heat-inducible transcription repressor HrcA [Staphylococcus condimenti]
MITNRQQSILNAIVEDYVDYGLPIGSKTVIERHQVNVSPATIRNEMKLLEDMGLIEKVHASSGRSPSIKGFRYYVDQLLENTSPRTEYNNQRLNKILADNNYNLSNALSVYANELSMSTKYTTLIMKPNQSKDLITDIHLFNTVAHLVIMVIVFESGNVEHLQLAVPEKISKNRLVQIANYIKSIFNADEKSDFSDETFRHSNDYLIINQLIELLNQRLNDSTTDIFFGGKANLIDTLNEQNVNSIQQILQYLESNKILKLFEDDNQSGIDVKIGQEIDNGLEDISIILSDYHIDNHLKGHVAVIGPTAMRYQNVIQLLYKV